MEVNSEEEMKSAGGERSSQEFEKSLSANNTQNLSRLCQRNQNKLLRRLELFTSWMC